MSIQKEMQCLAESLQKLQELPAEQLKTVACLRDNETVDDIDMRRWRTVSNLKKVLTKLESIR